MDCSQVDKTPFEYKTEGILLHLNGKQSQQAQS